MPHLAHSLSQKPPTEEESAAVRVANVLFDSRWGGPVNRVCAVALRLRARGIDTTVFLPDASGDARSRAEERGVATVAIPMCGIPNPRYVNRLAAWTVRQPADIASFRRAYAAHQIDIAHVNGAFFLAPAIAAKLAGIPLVWHLNDTLTPPWIARILGWIIRAMADRIVVAAEAVAVHYGLTKAPHEVIYAPVDVARFHPAALGSPDPAPRRVGLMGNWNPYKGQLDFVRAIAAVRHAGVDAKAVLIGPRINSQRAYAAAVDAYIADAKLAPFVEELGFVDDVPGALAGLDALVLASNSEACPMAVLEGMAAGLPIVATDVGGVRELLAPASPSPAGVVVPSERPDLLAEALAEVLTDESRARALGAEARSRAVALFRLEACVEAHERTYQSVAAPAARRPRHEPVLS